MNTARTRRGSRVGPSGLAAMLVTVTLLASGCIRSFHPFFSDADRVLEPALVGTWIAPAAKQMWFITVAKGRNYQLEIVGRDGRGVFVGRLGRLGGRLFLDLAPGELPRMSQSGIFQAHFQPLHTLIRVEALEPQLRLRMLDAGWLTRTLKAQPTLLRHERVSETEVILTASSLELGEFVAARADDDEVFPAPELALTRLDSSGEPSPGGATAPGEDRAPAGDKPASGDPDAGGEAASGVER